MKTPTPTQTMFAAALGVLLATGCKEKDKAPPAGTGSGSAAARPAEGSAPAPAPTPEGPAAPAATPKQGRELAQVVLDCGGLINAAKWDDFARQCMAPGFVSHQVDDRDLTREQVIPQLSGARAAFSDIKVESQLVLVNGRTLLTIALMKGTNDGPMKGAAGTLPATKQRIGVFMYERFAMSEAGPPSEQWAYADPATLLGQLGHLPPVRPAQEAGLPDAPVIAVAADDAREQANLAAIGKLEEALGRRSAADALALHAGDVLVRDQAAPADLRGKPQLEAALRELWRAFPDAKRQPAGTWAAGDYVVTEGKLTGTHEGPLGKLPKTGKRIAVQYAEVYRLAGGKVAEVWRFRNGAALASQLGLGAPAEAPAKPGEPPAKPTAPTAPAAPRQAAPPDPSSPDNPLRPPTPPKAPPPAPKAPVRAPDPPRPPDPIM